MGACSGKVGALIGDKNHALLYRRQPLTRPQLAMHIASAIVAKGGLERASGSWDIQPGNLKAVSEGRRLPGPRLLKLLGITHTADGNWVVTRKFAEDK